MNQILVWLAITIASFVAAWAIALVVSKNANSLKLVQSPNERSSHVMPTPSGGGIGIAVSGTLSGIVVALQSNAAIWGMVIVGAAIALLGFADDLRDLSSRLRFGVQAILVAIVVYLSGPLPELATFFGPLPGILLYPSLLLVSLWWINLFNFMDGIDGIAASEGVFILAAACSLWLASGTDAPSDPVWWWSICVAGACAGFLLLNWSPAKIFMGDAGSNYIALFVLCIALYTIAGGGLTYSSWLIITAVFVADATITLCRRMAGGQHWMTAHRSHGYQRLARRWASHGGVTHVVIAVNVFWLLPIAQLSLIAQEQSWWFVLLAYAPIVLAIELVGGGKVGD